VLRLRGPCAQEVRLPLDLAAAMLAAAAVLQVAA